MRHRIQGRTLGRNASHRKAMFRNMAASLIKTVRPSEDDPNKPKVAGRIITTLAKGKELRPYVERLITLARKARSHQAAAEEFAAPAAKNTDAWRAWRNSEKHKQWQAAIAPAVNLRRRAFAALRDKLAVQILFDELSTRFADRAGGYTRVVRLASYRLGDGGRHAMVEFTGVNDRAKTKKSARMAPEVAAS